MAAGEVGASWFETRFALLTMRVGSYFFRAFATCSVVTIGAALPKELRM
jgi:hypothetical protein